VSEFSTTEKTILIQYGIKKYCDKLIALYSEKLEKT